MTTEMEYSRCCALLEVRPDATLPEIHRAHRRLVLIWHPDRFLPGSELHAEAETRIRSIGEAYEFLMSEGEKRSLGLGAVGGTSRAETEAVGRKGLREAEWVGAGRLIPLGLAVIAVVGAVFWGVFLPGPRPDPAVGAGGAPSSVHRPLGDAAPPTRLDLPSDAQPFVVPDQGRTVLVFLPPTAELENTEGAFLRACENFRQNVASVRHELRRLHPEVSVQVIDAPAIRVGGETVHRRKTCGYGYILFEAQKRPLIIEGMPSTEDLLVSVNKYFSDDAEGRHS